MTNTMTGARLAHPVLGAEVIVADADETRGRRLVLDITIQPGRPRDTLRHVHRDWDERFEIRSGAARYELGGVERDAHAGETVALPRGVPHTHPWNIGDTPLVVRQIADIDPGDPAALKTLGNGFATLYGLAAEGKCDAAGKPSLLQGAATIRSFHRHGIYLAEPPVPVQKVMFGALAAIGWLVGVRATYPRFEIAR